MFSTTMINSVGIALVSFLLIIICSTGGSFKIIHAPYLESSNQMRNAVRSIALTSDSPVVEKHLWGRQFFIKRDDLMTFEGLQGLSFGNKVRKLQGLHDLDLFPRLVVSHGGSQSNAMRALALLCRKKGSQFVYATPSLPKSLREKPVGNLAASLQAGMKLVEYSNRDSTISSLDDLMPLLNTDTNAMLSTCERGQRLFVPQGGACNLAQVGVDALCKELESFISLRHEQDGKKWKIYFASGTGTMALFAQRFFSRRQLTNFVEVVAIPCVGSHATMLQELQRLDASTGSVGSLPSVLHVADDSKRKFAGVFSIYYEVWNYLQKNAGIEFDLLYAPRAFELLLLSNCSKRDLSRQSIENVSLCDFEPGYNLMYYHCGGTEGNESQLARYKYKYGGKSV